MIHFLLTSRHQYTLLPFLKTWPNAAAALIRLLPYEKLPEIRNVDPGVFVFSDLERLSAYQCAAGARLCRMISAGHGESLIVNHPARVLKRFELLQELCRRGVNAHRAFPCTHLGDEIRYPVFMRIANDHAGPITALIRNREEHLRRLISVMMAGHDPTRVITIEFCDTRGADGLYRKYAAFRIGDRIIPGHLLVSRDWMVKDRPPEPLRDEERNFLETNPHRDQLMELFRVAGIEYGRIDYGLLEGRIQVWEINTNPVLIQERDKYVGEKLPLKEQLVEQLAQAFVSLHQRLAAAAPMPIPVNRIFSGNETFERALQALSLKCLR